MKKQGPVSINVRRSRRFVTVRQCMRDLQKNGHGMPAHDQAHAHDRHPFIPILRLIERDLGRKATTTTDAPRVLRAPVAVMTACATTEYSPEHQSPMRRSIDIARGCRVLRHYRRRCIVDMITRNRAGVRSSGLSACRPLAFVFVLVAIARRQLTDHRRSALLVRFLLRLIQ